MSSGEFYKDSWDFFDPMGFFRKLLGSSRRWPDRDISGEWQQVEASHLDKKRLEEFVSGDSPETHTTQIVGLMPRKNTAAQGR